MTQGATPHQADTALSSVEAEASGILSRNVGRADATSAAVDTALAAMARAKHYPARRARCDQFGMRRVTVALVLSLRVAGDESGVHTTMNVGQREKEGEKWRLQRHHSNAAWPPWKRK